MLIAIENQPTNSVAAVQGAPGQEAGQLASQDRFKTMAGSKKHVVALVYDNQDGTFAFFTEYFGVCAACSGGDPPVDGAYVVAGLVSAHFLEIDTPAPEIRFVGARKYT